MVSGAQSSPPAELETAGSFFGGIIGWVRPMFIGHHVEPGRVRHGEVEGHPDLFCDSYMVGSDRQIWILDVKTTTGFSKMAHESYLQILAYTALARANGFVNNAVGLLLPIQRQILWFNLTAWDHIRYLEVLSREAEWVKDDALMYEPEYLLSHIDWDLRTTSFIEHFLSSHFKRIVEREVGRIDGKASPGFPHKSKRLWTNL